MKIVSFLKLVAAGTGLILITGCATKAPYDYSAYKESRPKSILVLPPLNNTPEVQASFSVLSYVTRPLAEAGYYVMPVTMVAEAFKENGMTQPAEMHATSAEKLRQIFGADAVLYITVKKYGTVFQIINSASIVTAEASLMDLKTGKQLWAGTATASSAEGENNQNVGGLVGLLVAAVVKQIVATSIDQSHKIAAITTTRLLSAGQPRGILFGPRSPSYGKD
jgi:hypothetical protein